VLSLAVSVPGVALRVIEPPVEGSTLFETDTSVGWFGKLLIVMPADDSFSTES
jgi:hypothetical protein